MKNRIAFQIFLFIALGIMGNLLWLYEIVNIIGWDGARWAYQTHFSIFIINGLTVFAYCFPIWQSEVFKQNSKNKFSAFFLLYICTLAAYYIAKWFLLAYRWLALYHSFVIFSILLLLTIGTPILIHFISNKFLIPILKRQVLFLIIAIVASCFLSYYTIQFLPNFAYSTAWVDAVKMGYNFFWIIVLMGLVGVLTTRFSSNDNRHWDADDILDID